MELSHAGIYMAYLQTILGSVVSNANLAVDVLFFFCNNGTFNYDHWSWHRKSTLHHNFSWKLDCLSDAAWPRFFSTSHSHCLNSVIYHSYSRFIPENSFVSLKLKTRPGALSLLFLPVPNLDQNSHCVRHPMHDEWLSSSLSVLAFSVSVGFQTNFT